MTEKPDQLTLHLLREIRSEMIEMKVLMKELASTQAALLQVTATQENRLLRIEKRLGLIEA